MKSTTKAVWHRLKQARSTVVRVEAAWAGAQFLFASAPVAVGLGLLWWARRRRNHSQRGQVDAAPPPADATVPTATRPANATANGLAN
ncbi:hypothetical protein A5647_05455 [Mycobacterium sp. 1100029.7]|nr:hypothetical protein A5647_05455 [Mycobacterium sp. 1100029.7]